MTAGTNKAGRVFHNDNMPFLFPQVYKDGKDLCETIWDDTFTVSADPCECLTLSASDAAVSASYSCLLYTSPSPRD